MLLCGVQVKVMRMGEGDGATSSFTHNFDHEQDKSWKDWPGKDSFSPSGQTRLSPIAIYFPFSRVKCVYLLTLDYFHDWTQSLRKANKRHLDRKLSFITGELVSMGPCW